uniref:Uncharacterized protein n=1 Tax=Anguilla anguilla TaxID=7936 RepID=A0A0E9SYT7_ANGAN
MSTSHGSLRLPEGSRAYSPCWNSHQQFASVHPIFRVRREADGEARCKVR